MNIVERTKRLQQLRDDGLTNCPLCVHPLSEAKRPMPQKKHTFTIEADATQAKQELKALAEQATDTLRVLKKAKGVIFIDTLAKFTALPVGIVIGLVLGVYLF